MGRFNNGLIFTNDNCISCNKCIAHCPVMGTNVSVVRDGMPKIQVDGTKCTGCGSCLQECVHDSREYRDDTELFLSELAQGKTLSLIVDASFFVIFEDRAEKILGYLKSLGVEHIYDCAFGAEISIWGHVGYLKEHRNDSPESRAFISQVCPAVENTIEKYHPLLVWQQIPVQSPLVCTAIYARKYLKDENPIAFLGSCIASKDEIQNYRTGNVVSYNVTYKKLLERLKDVSLEGVSARSEIKPLGLGRLLSVTAGLKEAVSYFFPRNETIISYRGIKSEDFVLLENSLDKNFVSAKPLMVEVVGCEHGCLKGPGTATEDYGYTQLYVCKTRIRNKAFESLTIQSPEENWGFLQKHFEQLRPTDFLRKFNERYKQPYKIPQSAYDEIFGSMFKNTPASRHINCGSCGYKTCSEMARAIAYGYNKRENCIHYVNEELQRRFAFDPQTGLPNRITFFRQLSELMQNNPDKQYLIAAGDINKFKSINQLYGQPAGDNVLRVIAAKIREISSPDGLCLRFGGGNFGLAVEYTPENMRTLRSLKFFDCSSLGINMPVTMRFGLYITHDSQEPVVYAVNCATISMDKNISLVENTYTVFTKEFRERIFLDADITAKMKPAIENDEFKIWFQPQYYTATGELVGAEVLCKWLRADGTIIPPVVFIPIAERNGYIRNLDNIIWEKAFYTMRQWLDEGLRPVPISINISRVTLGSDALIYTIKHLEAEYQIPTELIHFEVTESAYMEDGQNQIAERIEKIRQMGYQIAMDDFGSGYSSLNTLKDIPIDILKLDMGFLRSSENMDRGGSIISSVVRMAQNLELVTIAEGVETPEQADFLKSIGCDIIQGFLYAKSMPEEDYRAVLLTAEKRYFVEKPHVLGKIDVMKFYNVDSSESIMFENFSGNASIIEYDSKSESISLLRCNKKALALLGLEHKNLKDVRKLMLNFLEGDSGRLFLNSLKKAVESGTESSCVTENKEYKHMTPVWIRSHIWEISKVGTKHVVYVRFEDVTDEKLTESTLELANSQMTFMMDNKRIGMMLLHVDIDLKKIFGTVKIRVFKTNEVFAEMTGYPMEEITAWSEKETLSLIHPIDKVGFISKFVAAMTTGFTRLFSYDFRLRRVDRSYVRTKIMVTGMKRVNKSYMFVVNFTQLEDEPEPEF